jgi:ubiquinone/menaquinone biosynthesis C-methylase UbiE
LKHPNQVLKEIHRILKTEGTLSFSDHHMKESNIIKGVEGSGLFELKKKQEMTYCFSPRKAE